MKSLTNTQLHALLINMESLIFNIAEILVQHQPATKLALQKLFEDWSDSVKSILKE